MNAAHVMLAGNWEFSNSPVGWFISEKFDGIRAKWTGADLISREGHRLNAPDWFTAQLPAGRQLDGELWIDRAHTYAAVAAICGPRLATGEAWRRIVFQVFDLPGEPGTFAQRLNILRGMHGSANVEIVRHVECKTGAHFQNFFAGILDGKGEGIMIRDPLAPYVFGRSRALLKLKPFAA